MLVTKRYQTFPQKWYCMFLNTQMVSNCTKWLFVFFLPHLLCLSSLPFSSFLFLILFLLLSSLSSSIHPFSPSILDLSSSRTMYLDYLVMEPILRMDDLDLLVTFEKCIFSDRVPSEIIKAKRIKKESESDAFSRIMDMIMSWFSKHLSSSKSSNSLFPKS